MSEVYWRDLAKSEPEPAYNTEQISDAKGFIAMHCPHRAPHMDC